MDAMFVENQKVNSGHRRITINQGRRCENIIFVVHFQKLSSLSSHQLKKNIIYSRNEQIRSCCVYPSIHPFANDPFVTVPAR
jgi:hypothetical protein